MCSVASLPASIEGAVSDEKSLTPRQRRVSQRAQAAIFRNDSALFLRLLPQSDLTWRDPTSQHTLLVEAVIRLRVQMVRLLCHRLRGPEGLAQRGEAMVHLLQGWPTSVAQSRAYHACLAALLGDEGINDLYVPSGAVGWLSLAVGADNPALVEKMVALGAPQRGCRSMGGTLLHAITESDAESLLDWALSEGMDPNALDDNGETPLHIAARCGNLAGMIRLVAAGGDLNVVNAQGETPLAFFDQMGSQGWAWYHQRKSLLLEAALGPASPSTARQQRF